jgi:mannose-6-phosphate isomerase-like protein (cupin superfamily)
MQEMNCSFSRSIVAALLAVGALALSGPAAAQAQPRSFEASPDIYKVIAQNADYKVIEVTWKPGQKDQLHSHPASAVYYLTNCTMRGTSADGKSGEGNPRAGTAIVQAAIAGHTIENIGSSDCKLIMFEPK